MKFVVSILIIGFLGWAVYKWFRNAGRSKKTANEIKRVERRAIAVTSLVVIVLLGVLVVAMYRSATEPDSQCSTIHAVSYQPPISMKTAMDYYELGNYDYDTGNCGKAVIEYTASIKLDPSYPEAYNNRAYTLMRMQNYKDALPDLNKALNLNPNYIQALMNRGDIHNFYYSIDRASAIADYQKVISLGGAHGTSVCGHLFMAEHNGWHITTMLDFPWLLTSQCNQ